MDTVTSSLEASVYLFNMVSVNNMSSRIIVTMYTAFGADLFVL